jgi:transposase
MANKQQAFWSENKKRIKNLHINAIWKYSVMSFLRFCYQLLQYFYAEM